MVCLSCLSFQKNSLLDVCYCVCVSWFVILLPWILFHKFLISAPLVGLGLVSSCLPRVLSCNVKSFPCALSESVCVCVCVCVCLCLCVCLFESGHLCSPCWPGTHYIGPHGLDVTEIYLPLSPKCWH